eukprot:CAMPEP_0117451362 /NCGR_PEP_ID=MMETSP0759-20121206/8966_1 /TAXON_ID=63605 /ORGANISM="Percolomonas cosmopolitus, Strain WS" /LENGTH=682 /DNA_ID=CAMNT_0005243955 /DNA_START=234 /DNA_END=2279 /DNA_ORIENTATION=+
MQTSQSTRMQQKLLRQDSPDEQDNSAASASISAQQSSAQPKKARTFIEMSLCKYPLIRDCSKEMGWIANKGRDNNYSLFWMDSACTPERVLNLKSFQIINHFPGMNAICRKIAMAKNLKRMQKGFPKQYGFFPHTWILPHELSDFMKPRTQDSVFIIKPSNGCQGRGIILTKDKAEAHKHGDAVVQHYIGNPYLLDGYKFDLRIYVLVRSVDPLRVYVFNEGLVRICTEPYHKPTSRNISNQYMHLSNYSINKNNKQFSSATGASNNGGDDAGDASSFSTGSKRSFKFLNDHLRSEGHDPERIWQKIYNVINATLISIQPQLARTYQSCMAGGKFGEFHCFELLGFDVMLDEKMKPILLEVNHSPSWNTDTGLDDHVKRGLIRETMRLLAIDPLERSRALRREKTETRERLTSPNHLSSTNTYNEFHEQMLKQTQIEQHNIAEKNHLQNFVKIYPPKSEQLQRKYQTLLDYAEMLAEKENRVRSVYRETPIGMNKENRRMPTTIGVASAKADVPKKRTQDVQPAKRKSPAKRRERRELKKPTPTVFSKIRSNRDPTSRYRDSTSSNGDASSVSSSSSGSNVKVSDRAITAPPDSSRAVESTLRKEPSVNQQETTQLGDTKTSASSSSSLSPSNKEQSRVRSVYQIAKAKYLSPDRSSTPKNDVSDLMSLIEKSDRLHQRFGA